MVFLNSLKLLRSFQEVNGNVKNDKFGIADSRHAFLKLNVFLWLSIICFCTCLELYLN